MTRPFQADKHCPHQIHWGKLWKPDTGHGESQEKKHSRKDGKEKAVPLSRY